MLYLDCIPNRYEWPADARYKLHTFVNDSKARSLKERTESYHSHHILILSK